MVGEVTRVDLTAFAPAGCGHSHVLRYGGRKEAAFIPGRVAVSFARCSCPGARAKPGAWGHVQVLCAQCDHDGHRAGWRGPPCTAPGWADAG